MAQVAAHGRALAPLAEESGDVGDETGSATTKFVSPVAGSTRATWPAPESASHKWPSASTCAPSGPPASAAGIVYTSRRLLSDASAE